MKQEVGSRRARASRRRGRRGRGGAAARRRAQAQPKLTKVTLQLKWVTQAQFAGYYAALDEGLLQEGRPRRDAQGRRPGHHARSRSSLGGRREFGLDWLPNLFATREKGGKTSSRSRRSSPGRGMTELTWKSSGINSIAKMRGKKVGVWCCGNEPELFAALTKNGINPTKNERRDDRQPAVRHGPLPAAQDRRRRGDDLQRAGAGARDEEPDDRQALQARPT